MMIDNSSLHLGVPQGSKDPEKYYCTKNEGVYCCTSYATRYQVPGTGVKYHRSMLGVGVWPDQKTAAEEMGEYHRKRTPTLPVYQVYPIYV